MLVKRRVKCQDGSKVVPYFPLLLASQGAYSIPSKTEASLILKKLALNSLKAEP